MKKLLFTSEEVNTTKENEEPRLRKAVYVYCYRRSKGEIDEYKALLDLDVYNLDCDIEDYVNCNVKLLYCLTNNKTYNSKTTLVSMEEGKVRNNRLWLPVNNFKKAKILFIRNLEKQILSCKPLTKYNLQKICRLMREIRQLENIEYLGESKNIKKEDII